MPLTLEQYQQHFDHILELEEKRLTEYLNYSLSTSNALNAINTEIQSCLTHSDPDIRQATRAAICFKMCESDTRCFVNSPAGIEDMLTVIERMHDALRNHSDELNLSGCCLCSRDVDYGPASVEMDKTIQAMTQYGFTSIEMDEILLTKEQFMKIISITSLKKLTLSPPVAGYVFEWGNLGSKYSDTIQGTDSTQKGSPYPDFQQSKLETVVLNSVQFFDTDEDIERQDEQTKLLCALISAPKLRNLELSSMGFEWLNTENWQKICDAIQQSKLDSLNLWASDLAFKEKNHEVLFCNAIKNSNLRNLTIGKCRKESIDIEKLITALEDNYTITQADLPGESIALSKFLKRNQLIAEVETILARPYTSEIEPEFHSLRQRLKETIETYDACNKTEWNLSDLQSKIKLEDVQASLPGKFQMKKAAYFRDKEDYEEAVSAWLEVEPNNECFHEARIQAFQLKYSSERDNTNQLAFAFIAALPCCIDPENRLINFGANEQSLFDSYLFAAAGGIRPDLVSRPAAERVALLEYVFLKHFVTATRNGTSAMTFFASNGKTSLQNSIERGLASIPVTDIKTHTERLQALWDEVENDMRAGIITDSKNRNEKRERTEELDENLINILNVISQLGHGNSQVVQHTIKIA